MEERLNVITCSTWVPQGAARSSPSIVKLTKEDLAKIIKSTADDLEEVNVNEFDDQIKQHGVNELEEEVKIMTVENEDAGMEVETELKNEIKNNNDSDDEDIETKYNFDEYDDNIDGMESFFKMGRLAVHADNQNDPNIKDDDDTQSEKDDFNIKPNDNLIAVGHIDGDAAVLEVYVYNSEESSLFVHHDIFLPAVPLCTEWLNFDPSDETLSPANMVAMGYMTPVIDVWDLDLVDCLEPAFQLGRKGKKKRNIKPIGHSDAVLCLAWHRHRDHIIASGSVDQTVLLWDLQEGTPSQTLTAFKHRIQDLKWHPDPNQPQYLLTACSDRYVRLFDCGVENDCLKWKLDGEVEVLSWDPNCSTSNTFYAGTDLGTVYAVDVRQTKPLFHFSAHESTCSGLSTNAKIPGCLVTVSEDKTLKIWDLKNNSPVLVEERNPGLGVIHSISSNPDSPFVLSLGGSNKSFNFKVWDMRDSNTVRKHFYDRLGLPFDESNEGPDEVPEPDNDDEFGSEPESNSNTSKSPGSARNSAFSSNSLKNRQYTNNTENSAGSSAYTNNFSSNHATNPGSLSSNSSHSRNIRSQKWQSKKSSNKRKGGHLDKKRR